MRALVIGPEEKAALGRLRDYAEDHKIGVDEVLDIFNGRVKPVGDRPGFSTIIPVGYRVVFCIEYQKKGWARHASIGINPHRPGKCANPAAINEILPYLGFKDTLEGVGLRVYFEDENTVVNVIEYIK